MGAASLEQRGPLGPLTAGSKLGRYEVLAKLAAGGMAVVYVARAHGVAGFERLVAIKVLHANLAHEEEFIKMFLDEARLAARIRHPNVVPTIDISDSEEAGYFIVMDYIEGDHLGQILASAHKDNERLPVPVTLRVVVDALGGLGAAHDLIDENGKHLGLVHRDVSPHNIMVGRDGVARLTDFGVAKAEDRLTHTRDGQVKGKLAYMAPEQASSGKTDSRSDLFSMGVILWECITGRRLFRTESTAATLHKLMNEDAPAPSTVDPALAPLDGVLAKALARDPDQRYRTAEEFAQAIEDAATGVGGLSSLRAVSKAVKQYAAAKLKRDKKLIDDAVLALKPTEGHDGGAFALDAVSEPSGMSQSDVSVGSLSMSKVSGVFAHATMPGAQPGGARNESARGGAPPPPPPLGTVPSIMPEVDGLQAPVEQMRGGPRPWLVVLLLVGMGALCAVYWLAHQEEVRVQTIEPTAPVATPAVPPAPVTPVATAPAAPAPAAVAAPTEAAKPAAPTEPAAELPAEAKGAASAPAIAPAAPVVAPRAPAARTASRPRPTVRRPAPPVAPKTAQPPPTLVVKPVAPKVEPPKPAPKHEEVSPFNPYR
jgi:serine/threonine-protein kinase